MNESRALSTRSMCSSLFLGCRSLARLLRKALLLHLILFHEQLRIFRAHQNGASIQQSENQLVVAAARLGKLTDDSLLESADRQPILINSRFLGVEVQGVEACLDVGPQRFDDVLALVPTRLAADSRVVRLDELG